MGGGFLLLLLLLLTREIRLVEVKESYQRIPWNAWEAVKHIEKRYVHDQYVCTYINAKRWNKVFLKTTDSRSNSYEEIFYTTGFTLCYEVSVFRLHDKSYEVSIRWYTVIHKALDGSNSSSFMFWRPLSSVSGPNTRS